MDSEVKGSYRALSDLYGRAGKRAVRDGFWRSLDAALAEELSRNRPEQLDVSALPRGGLRTPLAMLVLSVAVAAAAFTVALDWYRVREGDLFLQDSDLFTTESLLIDALRARSDLEIAKRDRIIEEFRLRAEARAAAAATESDTDGASGKPVATLPGDDSPDANAQIPPPPSVADGILEKLRSDSELARLGALAATEELQGRIEALEDELAEVRDGSEALSLRLEDARRASEASEAALSASARSERAALERLAEVRRERDANAARAAALEAELAALARAAAGTTTESAARAGALEDRVSELEAENARLSGLLDRTLAGSREAPEEPADARFIGTVSIVSGDRVIIELAAALLAEPGDLVLVYRSSASGLGRLIAVATVKTIRSSSLELAVDRLTSDGDPVRLRDLAYLSGPD
ncbi:MAG: hypothetical protein JXA15_05105 [Spirochaetales bacterium]|nr:hypothetical protein [Spirochaetales bacterium]